MKKVVWKWDKDVFVAHCPHCDDLAYKKDHCVFCHQPFEWVDAERPPCNTGEVNKGEYTIIQSLLREYIWLHLYKNNKLVQRETCEKILTKEELLQKVDLYEKRAQAQ